MYHFVYLKVAMCVGMVMRPEMSPPFSIQKVWIRRFITNAFSASQVSQSLTEAYRLVRERLQSNHMKEEELYNHKVHGPPLQEG